MIHIVPDFCRVCERKSMFSFTWCGFFTEYVNVKLVVLGKYDFALENNYPVAFSAAHLRSTRLKITRDMITPRIPAITHANGSEATAM